MDMHIRQDERMDTDGRYKEQYALVLGPDHLRLVGVARDVKRC
jgi:hypothetical protein